MKLTWLSHDCFRIETKDITIYTDPFQIPDQDIKADFILISHGHFDHMSKDDVKKVSKQGTEIITSQEGAQKMQCTSLSPGQVLDRGKVRFEGVFAYNLNKFRDPDAGTLFHPKGEGIGFVIEAQGYRIYHAGDSDAIPELANLKADIALLPVSGIYVMTAEEAVLAVKMIKPKLAIPMHFGAIVGSPADAEEFKRMVEEHTKTKVIILAQGQSYEVK